MESPGATSETLLLQVKTGSLKVRYNWKVLGLHDRLSCVADSDDCNSTVFNDIPHDHMMLQQRSYLPGCMTSRLQDIDELISPRTHPPRQ